MSRLFKYISYLVLFAVLFVFFLYWVFPYDALKERILGDVERQLGGGLQVSAKSLEPHWFTGVEIENLEVEGPGERGMVKLVKFGRVRARAGLLSLIFGSPNIKFRLDIGKGEISGRAKMGQDTIALKVDVDDLNLADFAFIRARTGLNIVSRIDGKADLKINRQQAARSTGNIGVTFENLRLVGSQLNLGDLALEIPDLLIAKGKDSRIKMSLGKGTMTFENFDLKGGDLGLELKGKVFLSRRPANYRLNLRGQFSVSEKLNEAFPFLFIVDSQKKPDGSYPLSITGRVSRPSIKIGTFTVPL
jgi:type II secretion system protein N